MRDPPLILVVDDNAMNVDILQTRLTAYAYDVITAGDGEQALAATRDRRPDLILLDIMMPKIDGIGVCKAIKADRDLPFIPVVMVTAKADSKDIIAGLDAGADEYLTKPVDQAALVARVKSMLRIKALHDTVQEQADELAAWNRKLHDRVMQQVDELNRVSRLKRFFSPQLADVIVSEGGEELLKSHRGEVSVVFCDLRGFTAFSETSEPEAIAQVLHEYHVAMGEIIFQFGGTIERFIGDGIMVLFNDPLRCEGHELKAVQMAVAMRDKALELAVLWGNRSHELGFGVGIAQGAATMGKIGFEGRFDYSATGTVVNLASRLSDRAQNGQILVSPEIYAAVANDMESDCLGELELKGFSRAIAVHNVTGLR